MTKRAILHIPHRKMLVTQPIQYWIEQFEKFTRLRPREVVLPAIGNFGPTFESEVSAYAAGLGPNNLLPDWIRQVRKLLGNNTFIWASIIPTYSFLETESCMVQDQYGSRLSEACCITNPTIQKMTDRFMNEITAYDVNGVVFDVTDIYPNSGSDSVKGIQNTCFCQYCLKQLKNAEGVEWEYAQTPFVGPNNISRFVLHVTESGASQIEAHHEWISNNDTAALIGYAEARRFVSEKDNSPADAEKLLSYLAARGMITAASIKRLGQVAQLKNLAVAIILGDENFDMSQSTDLSSLLTTKAANEYWLPFVKNDYQSEETVIQYLFAKATYGLNAFFEVLGDADNTFMTVGVEEYIRRLLLHAVRIKSNRLNPGAILAVELTDEYKGFVGVPIGPKDIAQFVDELGSQSLLGSVVPRETLDTIVAEIRLASPEKS